MAYKLHKSLLLNDKSYLSLIKKEIKQFAEGLGYGGAKLGEVEIIVAEITSNLFKHATKGREILYKAVEKDDAIGIEIIAIDSGPGMRDSNAMLKDGVSTSGTLGHGLGAIRRLSHEFDMYSMPDWGTVLLARHYFKSPKATRPLKSRADIGAILVPKPGETACGDGWAFKYERGLIKILAMDGLGHGAEAEDVSRLAAECFMTSDTDAPNEMLLTLHDKLRKTRGGVGSVLAINTAKNEYKYCGIGNILGRQLTTTKIKSLLSYNGIVGLNKPSQINNLAGVLENKDVFVITSDGLKTRWDPSGYPGMLNRDSSLFAAVLYKDYSRRNDDSMVIVVRLNTVQ